MYTRRRFLGAIGLPSFAAAAGLPLPLPRLSETAGILETLAGYDGAPENVASDEDFWAEVARAFTVDRSLVNLNNGGVSPAPGYVQEAMKRHLDYSNEAPAYTMWRILEPQREAVRERVARQWGVDPEEVAFTRNASESLQTLQFGIDLEPGDEVLTTNQDYPRMLTTFQQRERREGIVLRQFSSSGSCRGSGRGRAAFRAGDHAAHPADSDVPHDQPHGPDPAGARGGRDGPAARASR